MQRIREKVEKVLGDSKFRTGILSWAGILIVVGGVLDRILYNGIFLVSRGHAFDMVGKWSDIRDYYQLKWSWIPLVLIASGVLMLICTPTKAKLAKSRLDPRFANWQKNGAKKNRAE